MKTNNVEELQETETIIDILHVILKMIMLIIGKRVL